LIEVTLSLGIVASGILLLFALVPEGLNTLHEASKKSMGRQIAQNIISDMLLHDWDELHTFDSVGTGGSGVGVRYFDDYGIELTAAQKDDAVFRVRVRVAPRDMVLDHYNPLPAAPNYQLPDDPGTFGNGTMANLRRVHVDITNVPTPYFDNPANFGTNSQPDHRVRTFTTIISNQMDVDTLLP
jgi:uncharacterized protein (TIGR02598 family)